MILEGKFRLNCLNLPIGMKIIQLQLYVLMFCQAAVADQQTDLGSNVTINCDLDENEVYWILQKTPDPPTVILRSHSPLASSYLNKTFRKKYSVQFKHRLVINNVTADELGVYYCMKTSLPPKFSNSTRIYITELDKCTDSQNQTMVKSTEQNRTVTTNYNEQKEIQWTITIICAVMNGFLIIVVVGLVKAYIVGNRRSTECTQDPRQIQAIEQHQDPEKLQYTTMDISKFCTKMWSSQVTYAALNLQKS